MPQEQAPNVYPKVRIETVWLTIKQLALLFDRDRTVIGRHIKNIFTEGELQPSLVCAKFAHTGEYGRNVGYTQTKDVVFYNLDVIISVGYRVKSVRGTQFRLLVGLQRTKNEYVLYYISGGQKIKAAR